MSEPTRLLIDERLGDDGQVEPTYLVSSAAGLALACGEGERALPPPAIAVVMRRYGRELDPAIAPGGEALDLPGLGRLQRLRFRAAVDADSRDYLVWREP